MSIKRINEFPDGSGTLTNDDIFLFMDNPSASGVTKKISLSALSTLVGGGGVTSPLIVDNIRLSGNTIASTSGNIIVNPSGNGALQRDSGGNARGQYAVDWQTVRSTGTMVAAGNYSVIGGGQNNRNTGTYSVIGGGFGNSSSNFYSVVTGGQGNTASQQGVFIGGGQQNSATTSQSLIVGGVQNTVNGVISCIVGGSYNNNSGGWSIIGGGTYNRISGSWSVIGGGRKNEIITGTYSVICGGNYNLARSSRSFVNGTNNVAASKVRRASNITSSTNTITVLNATAADFDNTTANAISIRYFFNNTYNSINRTVSSATQSGSNVTLVLTTNVGETSQTWSEVSVVNTSESDSATGQVANGISNIASGANSTVSGGKSNTASGENSTVGGGLSNTSSGARSFVGGGYANNATINSAVVCGGFNNTANGDTSVVGGGASNTTSAYSSTVGGGYFNTSSGYFSIVGGGFFNTSSGSSSTIGGGSENTSSGSYSTVPGGLRGKATRYGELSHAAGRFAADGDAQHSVLIVRRSTTDATANVVLTLDGQTPSSSNRLTLPASTTWAFSIKLSAYNNTDNEGGWWIIRGGIRHNHSSGTSLIGSLITESGVESSLSSASVSVVEDNTNEALEIRVTGISGKTIRWVAVVDLSQVSFGTP